jgi:hypothetical protein
LNDRKFKYVSEVVGIHKYTLSVSKYTPGAPKAARKVKSVARIMVKTGFFSMKAPRLPKDVVKVERKVARRERM